MIDGLEIDEPDWAPFDRHPLNENLCFCGALWHSHARLCIEKTEARGMRLVTRSTCPGCGSRTHVRRSSSPPESQTLRA